ncbi:MAG: hypothetical protein L3V56_01080 [Candidatus Magnetoovum sp. WYHC-5]|nr:hypothetical protein [Candidatus Magnetoovum sp. WYHC-5]
MDFFNDEYTLDIKLLGYEKQAENIRNLILNCDTPYTIGISGRWGSGKTSMMKHLMASLGGIPVQQRFRFSENVIEDDKEKGSFNRIFDDYEKIQADKIKIYGLDTFLLY